MITLKVNGEAKDLDVSPEMPLLWALRDRLNLTGTKFGCGHGMCGACTLHIDGEAARSCSIMAGEAAGLHCVRDCAGVRAFRAAYQLVQREHPGFDVNEPLPPVPGLP